ncbi:unnamed protein product [Discosporangium mesarthrocarpum]
MFIGALIIYSVVVIPWRTAFNQQAEGTMLVMEATIDACFTVDIILTFLSAYFEEDILVYSRRVIAINYITSWFIPDVLSTFPFDIVVPYFVAHSPGSGVQTLKLIRCRHILYCTALPPVNAAKMLFMVAHWLCC